MKTKGDARMKIQTVPAGTILTFMGNVPVRLIEDTKVECGTDLGCAQDALLDAGSRSRLDGTREDDSNEN